MEANIGGYLASTVALHNLSRHCPDIQKRVVKRIGEYIFCRLEMIGFPGIIRLSILKGANGEEGYRCDYWPSPIICVGLAHSYHNGPLVIC